MTLTLTPAPLAKAASMYDQQLSRPTPDPASSSPRPTLRDVESGRGPYTMSPDPAAIEQMVVKPDPRRTFNTK